MKKLILCIFLILISIACDEIDIDKLKKQILTPNVPDTPVLELINPNATVKINSLELYPAWKVKSKWNEVEKALEYKIYKSNQIDSNYQPISTTDELSYEDNDVSEDTEYFYKISACNDNGCSTKSDAASILVPGESTIESLRDYYIELLGTSEITIPLNNTLLTPFEFTLEFYLQYIPNSNPYPRIIQLEDVLAVYFDPDDNLNFCLNSNNNWTCLIYNDPPIMEWFDLALQWNGENMMVFINGIKVDEQPFKAKLNYPSDLENFDIRIGYTDDLIDSFAGYIDNFSFSNIARYIDNYIPQPTLLIDAHTIGAWDINQNDFEDQSQILDTTDKDNHAILKNILWYEK